MLLMFLVYNRHKKIKQISWRKEFLGTPTLVKSLFRNQSKFNPKLFFQVFLNKNLKMIHIVLSMLLKEHQKQILSFIKNILLKVKGLQEWISKVKMLLQRERRICCHLLICIAKILEMILPTKSINTLIINFSPSVKRKYLIIK